jgi:RNA polymerase sigma-70 factor (ECF subfamily)
LFNFILRSVRDTDVASDLLQDVFARVVQRASEFNKQAKFSTWLYTIARNHCIDHSRRMKHRRHASLDAPGRDSNSAALVDRIGQQAPEVDREAASPELRARIAAAVEDLPEEQREVFLMRQLQNLPFAEIAAVVGVSENTVKSRMRYALERLQQALAELEEYTRAHA